MINDSNRRLYLAKDIKNLLGISSGQLFHWGQTWGLIKPEIKAQGRAYKDQYSFKNLLDLAFIKELINLGFEPSKIKQILDIFSGPVVLKELGGNIWDYYKVGREDTEEYDDEQKKSYTYPGYDKAGCLMLITRTKEGEYRLEYTGNISEVLNFLKHRLTKMKEYIPRGSIIINLADIVKDLEEKTGERL
jgi:DNA-binding transcriptional MerR regulator